MGVRITKKLQGFIIDGMSDERVYNGATVYCGACGGKVGVINQEMKLPFRWNDFERNLQESSLFITHAYFKHVPCNHAISFNGRNIQFLNINKYYDWHPLEEGQERFL